jgi:hypothetical protein
MPTEQEELNAAASGGQAEIPIGGPDGMWPDLRTRHKAWQGSAPLSDDYVRGMLADCCHFLRQLMYITSNVVETIGVGQVRQIVAAEMPVPARVILEDGTVSTKETPASAAPDRDPSTGSGRDHRKNPRGRKHPLITLLQMALQSVRLIERITTGMNPNTANKESLEQKKQREELKEEERELKNLLNGRF